jgi:hypothetical protein
MFHASRNHFETSKLHLGILLLAKIITASTFVAHTVSLYLHPKATKTLYGTSSNVCPALGGKKNPGHFSFFFSQQAEDKASIRIKLCDILNP